MINNLFLIVSVFLIVSYSALGQCVLRGKITDINGEIPIGTVIYQKSNKSNASITDVMGNYSLKINENTQQIIAISYIGYKTIEDTIICTKGGVLLKNYVLEPLLTTLNEVTVTAKAYKNNDAQLEFLKKRSSGTIDYISAETIKKTGDANVASAVTRVPGVSTSSGGLITVRGIGDRYLKTTINGSRIPTLDPFTNNIKLDIFPASLIDNIVLSKSARPDFPSDWAGAYLSIKTIDYPDTLSFFYETSFGYNNNANLNEVISSQHSKTDWLGFDNGFREYDHNNFSGLREKPTTYEEFIALGLGNYLNSIGVNKNTIWYDDTYFKLGLIQLGLLGEAQFNDPVAFENAKVQYNTLTYKGRAFDIINAKAVEANKRFNDNWKITTRKTFLNIGQTFSIGNQIRILGKPFGYILGLRYGNSVQYDPNSIANKFNYDSKIINNQIFHYDSSFQKVCKETNSWSALANIAYSFNPNNSIAFLFMPNVIGTNSVREADYYKKSEYGLSYDIKNFQSYESRRQILYQLKSDHYIPKYKIKIECNASYTNGKSDMPDLKLVSYMPPVYSMQNNEPQFLSTSVGTGRFFRYLTDNIFDSRFSVEIPLDSNVEHVRKIKFGGAYLYNKSNTKQYFYQLWPGYLTEQIVKNNPDAMPYGLDRYDIVTVKDPATNLFYRSVQQYYRRIVYPADNVFGLNSIASAFIMTDYAINKTIRVSGGLRVEHAYIYTDAVLFDTLQIPKDDPRRIYESGNGIGKVYLNPGELNKVDFLPSINIIYKIKDNEKHPINLRANYSQTLARPSLRELSDRAYFDYELNSVVRGNSKLQIVYINNYDLRLENYFKSGDNILISLFYKNFNNHIEVVNFGSTTGYVWMNNPNKSWARGIEIEGEKTFAKRLEFKSNITLVWSRSTFDKTLRDEHGHVVIAAGVVTHTMLGQAPYVVNAMLSYNLKKQRISTSINYNIQGPRLVITGIGLFPDIYELPRNMVDLKISKKFGKHISASIKIQDLLNTPVVRSYKVNEKFVLDYDRYRYGTNYGFSLSYKI